MACEEIFNQRLRERGFRLTPQREIVLSVMHGIEDYATVEEIFQLVHGQSAAIDISTVYRTLDLLQELDLASCVDRGDGQRVYALEQIEDPHLHLVCRSCGRVIGAELGPADQLLGYLQEQHGFAADLGHLSVPGLCSQCASSQHES